MLYMQRSIIDWRALRYMHSFENLPIQARNSFMWLENLPTTARHFMHIIKKEIILLLVIHLSMLLNSYHPNSRSTNFTADRLQILV